MILLVNSIFYNPKKKEGVYNWRENQKSLKHLIILMILTIIDVFDAEIHGKILMVISINLPGQSHLKRIRVMYPCVENV
nr:MAG TPA: hypothetical protein [Caudoviricetes sp.]